MTSNCFLVGELRSRPDGILRNKPLNSKLLRYVSANLLGLGMVCTAAAGLGQRGPIASHAGERLPDAPQPTKPVQTLAAGSVTGDSEPGSLVSAGDSLQEAQKPVVSDQPQQTKRILGIIPNFRSVNADVKLPPQSVKEKFVTATSDSFDYSSIFLPALVAAYSMGTDATPEFHQGAAGYARYFWHAAVDQTSENYMVEFVAPVITREDTRYYTLGHGGFLKRTGYSLSRVVITRTDSGRETFNLSEVVGAGASSGISSLYYPSRERSLGNTGKEWGLDVGIDAASFVVKEFWPDIDHYLFHASKTADTTTGR
jgi:hypothetical protein